MNDLSVDRIPLNNYLTWAARKALSRSTTQDKQFWSTPPRMMDDPINEIIEITFVGARLINYIKFFTAHFPHTVTGQWWDANVNIWLPLNTVLATPEKWDSYFYRQTGVDPLVAIGSPVAFSLSDSIPSKVNSKDISSASGFVHPQHLGADHWTQVSWRVNPVTTTKIRFILARGTGSPPVDPMGNQAAYSLGLREVQVGYRVNSRADIPSSVSVVTKDFGSSIDLLGSRVLFSLTEHPAKNVLVPTVGKVWRSEPQPVNYSVVNFYADTRDLSGEGQVIDRFFIDPLTVGAHVNVYYSNDTPEGSFRALDEGLDYPVSRSYGASSIATLNPQQSLADKVVFSGVETSYVDIDNAYLQFDPKLPWWLGMEQEATTGADGLFLGNPEHPWVSFGGNTLRLNGPNIEFVSSTGKVGTVPLSINHTVNARFSVAVIFNPKGTQQAHPDGYPDGLSLVYRLADHVPTTVTWAMTSQDLGARPSKISLGRYNNEGVPGLPAMALRALVLKVDAPPLTEEITWFTEDGSIFAKRAEFAGFDSGATNNALLRMHPLYSVAATNPVGLVGGPGDRFSDLVWTPISRDYVLRRGFLHLPPTRARFFKFEFTKLVAEHYESFVPIRRQIKMFSSATVSAYQQMSAGRSQSASVGGPGVQTMLDIAEVNRYSDAIGLIKTSASEQAHSATEALYVYDPALANSAAKQGWIWGFQPWHIGTTSPKFIYTQKHVYETLSVDHVTKIGYFAGLKALQAYRVDYMVDDETEIYVEHFHDQTNVFSSAGVTWKQNQLNAFTSSAQVVSKAFVSTRPVRAVQFATLQSDSYPMLSDDGFADADLTKYWSIYGDATLTRQADRTVTVNRGWFSRSYGQLEVAFAGVPLPTYGTLDGHRYAELEGALANGQIGGGINTERVTPGDSGRLYAAVKVAADQTLAGPVRLEIVSVLGNVVLASADRKISAGQEENFYVGYTIGSGSTPLNYSAIEGVTYGALDGTTYGSHQNSPIAGDVYARLIQTGRTVDTFTVRKLSLFDAPLAWDFSNDDGVTWFDAMDVRNNADGVLSFPEAGTNLRWRLRMFRPDTVVSALVFRPWYNGLLGSVPSHGGQKVLGPNRSVMDEFPDINDDPMWKQSDSPIPTYWYYPASTKPHSDESAGLAINPLG